MDEGALVAGWPNVNGLGGSTGEGDAAAADGCDPNPVKSEGGAPVEVGNNEDGAVVVGLDVSLGSVFVSTFAGVPKRKGGAAEVDAAGVSAG